MPDHVHMMISIPPKYAVSQVIGFIKGKSAICLAHVYGERKRNFVGQHFWAGPRQRSQQPLRASLRPPALPGDLVKVRSSSAAEVTGAEIRLGQAGAI
jgi:hypothetical protein